MTEWRDIESAPKDGTDILIWGKMSQWRDRPPVVAAQHPEWGEGWYGHDHNDVAIAIIPTHWMPLPAPPPCQFRED